MHLRYFDTIHTIYSNTVDQRDKKKFISINKFYFRDILLNDNPCNVYKFVNR